MSESRFPHDLRLGRVLLDDILRAFGFGQWFLSPARTKSPERPGAIGRMAPGRNPRRYLHRREHALHAVGPASGRPPEQKFRKIAEPGTAGVPPGAVE